MEYVIRAKGPALGPVGHSARTEGGKKKKIELEESIQQN